MSAPVATSSRQACGGGFMTSLSVVELPGLLRVLTLMILLGGTMCVLLYRDRPAGAGLFAATLGI